MWLGRPIIFAGFKKLKTCIFLHLPISSHISLPKVVPYHEVKFWFNVLQMLSGRHQCKAVKTRHRFNSEGKSCIKTSINYLGILQEHMGLNFRIVISLKYLNAKGNREGKKHSYLHQQVCIFSPQIRPMWHCGTFWRNVESAVACFEHEAWGWSTFSAN